MNQQTFVILFICLLISWTCVSPVIIFAAWHRGRAHGKIEGRQEILDHVKSTENQSS